VEKAIIVVPFWPTQNWFSTLITILISLPARLPRHLDIMTMPHSGDLHPLGKKMNLVACVVSGRNCMIQDLFHHGSHQQLSNTNIVGENGFFGVVDGNVIHFTRLKRKC